MSPQNIISKVGSKSTKEDHLNLVEYLQKNEYFDLHLLFGYDEPLL
jgi:hypothetical protein